MSNIFRDTGISYFQVPNSLIPSGILGDLRQSALKVYFVLLYQAQQRTRSDVPFTNAQLVVDAGIAPNSLIAGRTELVEHGLVQIEPISGGYIYVLCDPATKQPILRRKHEALSDTSDSAKSQQCPKPASARGARAYVENLSSEEKRHYFESRLPGRRKPTTGGFMALCPFHDDTDPSLKVDIDRAGWYCHGCRAHGGMVALEQRIADCDAKTALLRIVELLGRRDLIRPVGETIAERSFDYLDEDGGLLYQIRLFKDKKFVVVHPDPTGSSWKKGAGVRRVLYRLPEVIKAFLVIVNEGEKHCDRCKELFPESDIASTTNPFGAGSWREEFAPVFRGKGVFIIPDNDEAGRQHAHAVAQSVSKFALEVRIVNLPDLPPGGDVIDFLERHSREELMLECANCPPWKPVATS
jgi:hypothetical protein